MPWFRVNDEFADHPKLVSLGDGDHYESAVALWLICGVWCAKHLTDGFVPAGRVVRSGIAKAPAAALELVRVGLWTVEEGGYRFHDWTVYQPTREEVLEKRAQESERQRAAREKKSRGSPAPVTPPVTQYVQRDTAGDLPPSLGSSPPRRTNTPSRPVPSLPKSDPTFVGSERARELAAAEALTSAYRETFGRAWVDLDQLKAALDGLGPLARSPEPQHVRAIAARFVDSADAAADIKRAIKAFAADPFWAAKSHPMAAFAKDPRKYLSKAAPSSSAPSDFSHVKDSDPLPFG